MTRSDQMSYMRTTRQPVFVVGAVVMGTIVLLFMVLISTSAPVSACESEARCQIVPPPAATEDPNGEPGGGSDPAGSSGTGSENSDTGSQSNSAVVSNGTLCNAGGTCLSVHNGVIFISGSGTGITEISLQTMRSMILGTE